MGKSKVSYFFLLMGNYRLYINYISTKVLAVNQDFIFKTKTKPSVQNQDQNFASQDQDQNLFAMYTRGRPKSIFHFRP